MIAAFAAYEVAFTVACVPKGSASGARTLIRHRVDDTSAVFY